MKKNLIMGIIAMLAVTFMLAGVMAASSYDVGAKNVYNDVKSYDNAHVYKVTKDCSKVTLNKNTWKNREILSILNYHEARFPQKIYCGIIYAHK